MSEGNIVLIIILLLLISWASLIVLITTTEPNEGAVEAGECMVYDDYREHCTVTYTQHEKNCKTGVEYVSYSDTDYVIPCEGYNATAS